MTDQKNTILAIVLSAIVLIGWQFFFAGPQLEKQQQQTQQQQQAQRQAPAPQQAPATPVTPGQAIGTPGTGPAAPGVPGTAPTSAMTRGQALAVAPRVPIQTPSISGSISLRGGRIDDVALVKFRETVNPNSPPIFLLSPTGTGDPFYAEFGWAAGAGVTVKLPDANTVWTQQGAGTLTADKPVTLTWDNGEGLTFRRIISVDANALFTVKDEAANTGSAPVTLHPYALIRRHGTPPTLGYAVLHEGPVGVMGEKCLRQGGFSIFLECHQESYAHLEEKKSIGFNVKNAWFGFTDKYWSAILLPDTTVDLDAHFSADVVGTAKTYQADYLLKSVVIAPGATGSAEARLFAGPRETRTVDNYDKALGLNRFELLIDWGYLYFITKPMFFALDWLFHLLGNFGLAILAVTVIIKIAFFPLANKSYASMAKMKAVQPQMMALRERFKDDKQKQQTELMELYKREKINPLAGCLPILVQIPVFFALYKVLFVTIEMRHAPFFGWIKDLSAADPTNLFNLFGLIPFDPTVIPVLGPFLHMGIWPMLMGVTMWAQMKLNPSPPDPTQKMIFDWMPLIFTFMLATFPAGLVIYWAWNNLLSVAQQSLIMKKHGAKIELWDNVKEMFGKKKTEGS